jgi:carboxymethylenebutenolidase
MSAKYIRINATDGQGDFSGYLALPEGGHGPGLVVIQEIFGINTPMRQICDTYASKGYMALCPDLFWRQQPDIMLNDKLKNDWDRAFELYKGFDIDKGIEDISAAITWLRSQGSGKNKVGAVGYCLGGLLAYLTACRTDADAAVGYYGVGINEHLNEADNITGNLMLHIAKEDGFVDKEAQAAIHKGLASHAHVTLHDYDGADHAFARPDGEHYKADAAQTANDRTAQFFATHLGKA